MRISGLEKLTLTDFPGKVACIVFTQGCNFRCPFCQNSDLLKMQEGILNEQEVLNYIEKRKNILDGVVITGGEPTLQKGLKTFINKIKSLGLQVKLDTNGYQSEVVKELLELNLLDYVAMDIKNIFDDYNKITGLKKINTDELEKTIKLLKKSNIKYEFRTTIIKEFHDVEKLKLLCKYLEGETYFLQNYQESERVLNKGGLTGFTNEELVKLQEELNKEFPDVKIRGI